MRGTSTRWRETKIKNRCIDNSLSLGGLRLSSRGLTPEKDQLAKKTFRSWTNCRSHRPRLCDFTWWSSIITMVKFLLTRFSAKSVDEKMPIISWRCFDVLSMKSKGGYIIRVDGKYYVYLKRCSSADIRTKDESGTKRFHDAPTS